MQFRWLRLLMLRLFPVCMLISMGCHPDPKVALPKVCNTPLQAPVVAYNLPKDVDGELKQSNARL